MDRRGRYLLFCLILAACILYQCTEAQQRGSFNFAKKSTGERAGDLTTTEIAGISIGIVFGLGAMAVTMFFCYFVYRQQKQQESAQSSFDARKF